MSTFNHLPSMLIPYTWQRAPFMPHAWIVHDRIYTIFQQPERNWNAYYEPAYERKQAIRKMSGRIPRTYEPRRRHPLTATIYSLSQLRMHRYLQDIQSSKRRL